jgi:predicted AAA+ superfamily ATPase
MEKLFEKFRNKLIPVSLGFTRTIIDEINWKARLIGIKGARGVGKTTMVLQYIKKHYETDPLVLYVSLDDIWFTGNKLSDLTDRFVKQGGKILFLDEVHKYPNWSQEIKNIYDDFPALKIIFTGSSLLEISKGEADLSRRVIMYNMQGLSFREYLNYEVGTNLNNYSLDEILSDNIRISHDVTAQLRPLQHFSKYLRSGYYPFFKEVPELYYIRLGEVINTIIDSELPLLRKFDVAKCYKVKHMLLAIAEESPFIPNIKMLSRLMDLERNTIISYLSFLADAGLIRNLYHEAHGISRMQKPSKIFLENTNIPFAMGGKHLSRFNLNETFLANQLAYRQKITLPVTGSLLTDNGILLVVENENRDENNTRSSKYDNRYIASDSIEFGNGNVIPLWMFGFLY